MAEEETLARLVSAVEDIADSLNRIWRLLDDPHWKDS